MMVRETAYLLCKQFARVIPVMQLSDFTTVLRFLVFVIEFTVIFSILKTKEFMKI